MALKAFLWGKGRLLLSRGQKWRRRVELAELRFAKVDPAALEARVGPGSLVRVPLASEDGQFLAIKLLLDILLPRSVEFRLRNELKPRWHLIEDRLRRRELARAHFVGGDEVDLRTNLGFDARDEAELGDGWRREEG